MLSLHEFKSSYNRIDDNIADGFYLPCMRGAVTYDRISGYFGSTVFIIAWQALKEFIDAGGKMRIICSPVLSEEDREALANGTKAQNDALLNERLSADLMAMLESDSLGVPTKLLSCLIASKILTIKIAVVGENGHPSVRSLFHDKVGIFKDENSDAVVFRGSFNETYKGLSDDGNIESVDVFQSWDGGKDAERVNDAINLFERVWSGSQLSKVKIYDLPEAFQTTVFQTAQKEDMDALLDEIKVRISRSSYWKPSVKGRTPREHQTKALDSWVAHDRRGILKHATGSGKTFTAICAINEALKMDKTVLVLVPAKELLHQWQTDIEKSIDSDELLFLLCGDGNTKWRNPGELSKWTSPTKGLKKVIIAMMSTAASPEFFSQVIGGKHLFVVADEVHRLGSRERRKIFSIDADSRLGLSATPERYGDAEGTAAIFNYFGGIVEPEFSLYDAINAKVLTRYFYHPQKVYLTPEEQEEWEKLSKEISKLIARLSDNPSEGAALDNPRIKQLLINRSRILKTARNKIGLALDIIRSKYKRGEKWIVYCDNQEQMKCVRQLVEDAGYDAYEYFAEMTGDREETLKYFSAHGGVLVSIKCLDEGVDIPSTTHALILASSKNPREFIQRRGRVLRLSPGKLFAHIYDAITLPQEIDDMDSIVLGELSRAIQFGEGAENPSCITDLQLIAIDYGINYSEFANRGEEDD